MSNSTQQTEEPIIYFETAYPAYWVSVNGQPEELCLEIKRYKNGIIFSRDIFTSFEFLVNGTYTVDEFSNTMRVYRTKHKTISVNAIVEERDLETVLWEDRRSIHNFENPLFIDNDLSREINGNTHNVLNLYRIKNRDAMLKSFAIKYLQKRLSIRNHNNLAKTLYYIKKEENLLIGLWSYEKNMPITMPIEI